MNMRAWSLLLLLFLSSAISAQHADHYLDTPLPQAWEEGGEVFRQTLPVDDQWWKSFGDTTLDSLISIAVDRNYSVLTAIDRMSMAKAGLRMERSGFFPTVGINAGWTRQQTSGNTSELPQSTQHYYDVSANMSWELDIFGSIRQRVKAQKETFAASKEEYTAVMVSLSAQVASSYIQLRELQQELKVVERNCASQAAVLKITEVRYNTGLVSKLDVAQAKSVYFSTKASIPQLESGINQHITSLAVLLGTYPQEIRPVLERVGELPDYMEPISIGIPADLLMRRPDIRSAEHQINAQAASLGASKSDWLPQVFIKGSVGYASKDFKDLTKHKSFTYEIAPALSWTIFSGGKLVNATKSARAQLDEAIDQFNQTVLTAVQETDNAMTAYRSSIKQIVALREVRNQGQETLTLSLDLYKQGLTPFQNVLDAQRSLLSYENQLVQARGNSLLQLIALYQALGGGWNN
ncbi:TolC family protein [Bacteroides salyersiae]|uniref:efflux transporter outer membrane subunit n=1 Tax=Bacteroides salyersiae TaxID=291644 RepID=UPI001C394018|nr:TolC family protein [Bacteroides salyersiae]MBV4205657.1 TolC family protein [Bacteroides salyersiae]MCB6650858.1 TolC family protein [Bacteroides salyersiae]